MRLSTPDQPPRLFGHFPLHVFGKVRTGGDDSGDLYHELRLSPSFFLSSPRAGTGLKLHTGNSRRGALKSGLSLPFGPMTGANVRRSIKVNKVNMVIK